MRCPCLRWGGRVLLAVFACSALGADKQPVPVQTRVFDIHYQVDEAAEPLDSVQLWYTLDKGMTWHQYGLDEDRQSPVAFHAPCEGEYGFYLVLRNSVGVSSGPPAQGAEPHEWAFVDFTPPVVQLHPLRETVALGQRVVQVRWTAIDQHLLSRPVTIAYQQVPEGKWYPVSSDPVANTGRYDWRVPDGVTGAVALRVTVRDRGGHEVASEPGRIDISNVVPPPVETERSLPQEDGLPSALQQRRGQRADRLFQEALACQQRGEFRTGVARLREVIKLDANRPEVFAIMADMLYGLDDYDMAAKAYDMALELEPTMRAALLGSALVYKQERDYTAAAGQLRTILRYNPKDAEIWLYLGDIAIYQGDELLARECYTRAATVQPEAAETVTEARSRVDLLDSSSRKFQGGGN